MYFLPLHIEQARLLSPEDGYKYLELIFKYTYDEEEPTEEELEALPGYLRALWMSAKIDVDNIVRQMGI